MGHAEHSSKREPQPQRKSRSAAIRSGIQFFPRDGHTEIDVVYIHGLGGSWQQTWGGIDFSSSWLRLIHKDLPVARVVTCGFSVIESMRTTPDAFERASQLLLERLEVLWRNDSIQRPLVFFAHSLGGLILKDLLMSCAPQILDAVKGVIFLSTPRFRKATEWDSFGLQIAKYFKEQQILTAEKAEFLLKVNDDFERWLEPNRIWAEKLVYCFSERLPVYRLGLIVPEHQAGLSNVKCITSSLHADHFSMSRCRSAFDPQYQRFSLMLKTMSVLRIEIEAELSTRTSSEEPEDGEKSSLLLDGREFLKGYRTSSHAPMRLVVQGLAFEDQGQYSQAEYQYDRAIELCSSPTEDYTSIKLFCKDKKALMLMDRCDYQQADSISLETLKTRQSFKGKADPATLLSAGNRARILRYLGRYSEAHDLLRDALANVSESPFATIIGTTVISILAKVLKDQGVLEVSEVLTRDVVRACEYHLGRNHPFTYNRQSDLGAVLSKRGQFVAAEEVTRRALDGLGTTLGAMHPHTLRTSKRLGRYLRFQGRLAEAQPILQTTLERQATIFSYLHPDTLSTQCTLAALYALSDRLEEAELLLQRTLRDRTKLFGETHPDVIWTGIMLDAAKDLRQILVKQPQTQSEDVEALRAIFSQPTTPSKDSILTRTQEFQCPTYDPDRAYLDGTSEAVEVLHHAGAKPKDSTLAEKDLRYAAATGEIEIVQIHLENEVNINAKGGYYGGALQAAAFSGREDTVKLLLGWSKGKCQKANVNSQGGILGNALRAAALGGHEAVVCLLLANGADPGLEEHHILGSALEAALVGRHETVVKLLIESQPDSPEGLSHPLNRLIRKMFAEGNFEIVQFLVKAIADSNKKFALDHLQLDHSMMQQNLLQLLLKRHAVVQQSEIGSALQAALASGNVDAIKMLLNPRTTDSFVDTPDADVVATSIYGLRVVVRLLLEQNSKNLESIKTVLGEKAVQEKASEEKALKEEKLEEEIRHSKALEGQTSEEPSHLNTGPMDVATGTVNISAGTAKNFPKPKLERKTTKFTDDVKDKTKATPFANTERRSSSKSWAGRSSEEKSGLKALVRRNWRRMTWR